eukprot:RCo015413
MVRAKLLLPNSQGLLIERLRFRSGGLALGNQQIRETGQAVGDLRVVFVQPELPNPQGFFKQPLRGGVLALIVVQRRKIVHARCNLVVVIPKLLLPNAQRLLKKWLCGVVQALLKAQATEVVQGVCQSREVGSRTLPQKLNGLLVQGLCGSILALVPEHTPKIVQAFRNAKAILSQAPSKYLQSLLIQRLGLRVHALFRVKSGQSVQASCHGRMVLPQPLLVDRHGLPKEKTVRKPQVFAPGILVGAIPNLSYGLGTEERNIVVRRVSLPWLQHRASQQLCTARSITGLLLQTPLSKRSKVRAKSRPRLIRQHSFWHNLPNPRPIVVHRLRKVLRELPSSQNNHYHPKAPHVQGKGDPGDLIEVRRHVGRSALAGVPLLHVLTLRGKRNPKVSKLQGARGGDQDVSWLQVIMNDALVMKMVQPTQHL